MARWIEKNFLLIALVLCIVALVFPEPFVWTKPSIRYLLGLIMFGMGITLKPADFLGVWRKKRLVSVGVAAQFVCMPLIAFLLCKSAGVEKDVLLGFVLLGACPGGTASNVVTYLARGNVALSVSMTLVSTLLSPLFTPLLVWALAGNRVDIPVVPMLQSIAMMVVFPVVGGVMVRQYLGQYTDRLLRIFPPVSILCISWIIAIVIALNRARLFELPLVIGGLVVLHNALGLAAGYLFGRMCGASGTDARTMAIEVGMQNSGLSVALATRLFSSMPLAALPGALFSLWHNVSGIGMATWWQRHPPLDTKDSKA